MRRNGRWMACVVLLSSVAAAQSLRGRVSDLVCGKNVNPACNKRCIANGEPPVLVLDDSGDILTIQNPEALKPYGGEHVEVSGSRSGSVLTVNSVTRITESAAAPAQGPWLGTWVGVYKMGKRATPVWLHLEPAENGTKATLDMLPRDFGLAVREVKIEDDRLTARVPRPDGEVVVEVRKAGDSFSGTATRGGESVPLLLAKRAPVDLKTIRSYEGMYRAGSRVFLFEHLAADYINLVELPSGAVRGPIPVAQDEFIIGPTLMESLPVEKRAKFVRRADGEGFDLAVSEGGRTVTAHPVPLRREEVTFHNGEVKLAGTLILPEGPGPHPAIVFMHGSGGVPRTSYFGLGYWLASKGFVVLKYDKRGSGDSTGDEMMYTYENLADDAIAGAKFLQARPEVDPKRVGFWGLSEGAWTAALAAARFPEAAFAIIASGGGLSPADLEILVTEEQLRSDGRFSRAQIEAALAFQRARDHYMRTGQGWEEYAALREKAIHEPWYSYPITDLFGPGSRDSMFWKMDQGYYFYDPAPALKALRCPILSLTGGLDAPLLTKPNTTALRAALSQGHTRDFTIKIFPDGDHELFQASGSNQAELSEAQRFVPGFFPYVTAWLERVTAKKTAAP